MLLFIDTEFTDLRKNAELISIGVISERGDKFYAEITDYDKEKCNDFVLSVVIPRLICKNKIERKIEKCFNVYKGYGTKLEVGKAFKEFLTDMNAKKITFVSDVCHYDAVLIFDLLMYSSFGEIPDFINPMFIDISTFLFEDSVKCVLEASKNRLNILTHEELEFAETYAFDTNRESMLGIEAENNDIKHNAFWDAYCIMELFYSSNAGQKLMIDYRASEISPQNIRDFLQE